MHFLSLLLNSVSSTVFMVFVEVPFTSRNVDLPWAVSRASRNGIFEEPVFAAAVLGVCGCFSWITERGRN